MNFIQLPVLLLFVTMVQQSRGNFIVAYSDNPTDNETKFDFKDLVILNKEFKRYNNICPLRIYGGTNANISDIPYQVSVRVFTLPYRIWDTLCGGSLITLRFVISAAHCFIDKGERVSPSHMRVFAGTTKSYIAKLSEYNPSRKIKNVYIHKLFDDVRLINDFSIVEVRKDFTTTDNVKPIRLRSLQLDGYVQKNEQCIASGFGLIDEKNNTYPNRLQMVCVPIISMEDCRNYFGYEETCGQDEDDLSTAVCAGSPGKDVCSGDSGGPLVCQGVLTGLVSWSTDCGNGAVYTRVSLYTDDVDVPLDPGNSTNNNYCCCYIYFLIFLLHKFI